METEALNGFRVASAVPGRIRLQSTGHGGRAQRLRDCAERLLEHEAVQEVRLAVDAGSLILCYRPSGFSLPAMLRDVAAIAKLSPEEPLMPARGPARSVAHAGRGRPINVPPQAAGKNGAGALSVLPAAGSALERVWAALPGQTETIRAEDMPTDRRQGLRPLAISTAAVALAAVEAIPAAIVGSALAVAAIPVLERAARGVRKRQLTVDQLDAVNIGLLALQGEFLIAGAVAWLLSLGELVRSRTVLDSRRELARALSQFGGHAERQRRLQALHDAPLSNTRLQDTAAKASAAVAYPLALVALVDLLLTRDPGAALDIIKPGRDFEAGLRFGVPAPMLDALAETAGHGPLFTSARAVENMARVNAVVIDGSGPAMRSEELESLVEALLARGIRHIVTPTGNEAQIAQAVAVRRGVAASVSAVAPERMTLALERLRAAGLRIAILGSARRPTLAFTAADVWVALAEENPAPTDSADLFLSEGGLNSLPQVIDASRKAIRIARQNTTLVAGAALINVTAGLLGRSVSPLPTLLNTSVTAAVGLNTRRPLYSKETRRRSIPPGTMPPGSSPVSTPTAQKAGLARESRR